MDIALLTAFLAPFLPFLLKLGEKAAEKAAEKFGEDGWGKAKAIWSKLGPKVEAKEDTKVAAEQVAAKPESDKRQAVLQEELEILLKENPNLAEAITQIMQEGLPIATGIQIQQTVSNNQGQVIGHMTGGRALNVQGGADTVNG